MVWLPIQPSAAVGMFLLLQERKTSIANLSGSGVLMRHTVRVFVFVLSLSGPCMAATAPMGTTPPDIPKMADEFAKKMNLVGPVVCTPAAIDGPRFVCMAPVNPGVTVAPTGFFCAPDTGCWVPP